MKRLLLLTFIAVSFLWSCSTQRTTTQHYTQYVPPEPQASESGTVPRAGGAPDLLLPQGAKSDVSAAMIVGADGVSRPLTGYEIGSPGAPLEFTALETQHVKFVWMSPRTGEMLMLPLQSLQASFHCPCQGEVISPYGMRSGSMHTGVDLRAHAGDTIRAVLDGIVRMSKEYGGYGNLVVVRHACGLETLYGHNSRNLVAVNQYVRAGQAIALAGRTGRATTEHCHFEFLAAGKPFDPCMVVDIASRCVLKDTLYIFNKGEELLVYNSLSSQGLFAAKAAPAPTRQAERIATAVPAESAAPAPAAVAAAPPGRSRIEMLGAQDSPTAATAASSSPPSPASPPAPPAPERSMATGKPVTHTLERGESLSKVARRYGLTVDELCRLNGIENPDRVEAGQVLRLRDDASGAPAASSSTPQTAQAATPARAPVTTAGAGAAASFPTTAAAPATSPAAAAPEGEGEWYTVKKGDGLYRIAVAHSTTVARLCELNGIENADAVREGQRIRVR